MTAGETKVKYDPLSTAVAGGRSWRSVHRARSAGRVGGPPGRDQPRIPI